VSFSSVTRSAIFLGGLWRVVRPVLWSGAKTLRRETLRTGGDILTHIARSTDEDPQYIVSRRLNETAQNLIGKFRGRGRKREAGVVKRKKAGRQETEAYKKIYILLRGISLNVAANHVCVSEFRVRYICP